MATPPATTGNTIPPPPRMTGNTDQDLRSLIQWSNNLYAVLAKTLNVTRAITDHENRISNLENN